MNAPIPVQNKLAAEFCRILNAWLTADELREAVHLNAIESNPGICHSHDHCDANQAMLDAWEVVFGEGTAPARITEGTTDEQKASDDAIWNQAWNMAKAAGFQFKLPLKKGETIEILPEWQDKGDAERQWFVYEDEHGGNVGIFTPMPSFAIQPWQSVSAYMVKRKVQP